MRTIPSLRLLLAAGLLLATAGAAAADTVWDAAKGIPYKGRIVGLKAEGLVLEWEVGRVEKVFILANIKKLAVDDLPELNAAEDSYADGDYKKATPQYVAALAKTAKPWLRQYVNARLAECYGQSNQFARAVKVYIELCQTGSPLAAMVKLPPVMAKGSADNAAARKSIEDALAAAPEAPYADSLKRIRINILMVEGDPVEVLNIVEAELKGSDPELRQQARIKHIELLLKMNRIEDLGESLKQARRELDPQHEPEIFFYEGRHLYARKDYLRAALSFMRVPILYSRSSKEMAAEALYWAARSMYEAKAPLVEVRVPLEEAVAKFPGTPGAAEARKMLKDLGADQ